jgi:uncharacterized protein
MQRSAWGCGIGAVGRTPVRCSVRHRVAGLSPVITLLALAGCVSGGGMLARPAPETLPYSSPLLTWTLSDADAWLRHHVMFAEPDRALALLDTRKSPISDSLLRSLQRAIVLRQSGDFDGSNDLLEWADQEAERRLVRSVSKTAASFLLNDRILAYAPSPGEMGMIPFYRMMNYLSTRDMAAAAVEARRLTALLDRQDRGAVRRCRGDAMLQYLAGLAFEAAGELNDALVSLRRSDEGFSSCEAAVGIAPPEGFGADLFRVATRLGVTEVADSARARYPGAAKRYVAGAGEVLVVFERGFVAHLTEEALEVPILIEDVEGVDGDDAEGISHLGASIAAQLLLGYEERGAWGSSAWHRRRGLRRAADIDDFYFLRLAWPGIRRDTEPTQSIRLLIGEDTTTAARVADLSTIAAHDLEARRAGMLTRLVTRGIAKYLITREMEKKAEEEGGKFLGTVTGLLANAAANELERADTRNWSLLPDEVAVARLTLPAGSHQIRVQSVSPAGEVSGTVDLASVDVRAGGLTVLHHRLWSDDLSPLSASTDGESYQDE